ncbi:acyltransferase family protein [Kitasatospora albolonga]|uniref:acyltransferase family protein n=1 Tax=Kitasatospora albolonga TaxID=68173 RepID=UPI0035E87973
MRDMPHNGTPVPAYTLQDMREARGSAVVPGRSRYAVDLPLPLPYDPAAAAAGSAGRYQAVDGLRGLAVLSVLLYHTNWFERGLFGVDAFFVLSGFLVTLLLVRELHDSGRIALGRFYRRRVKQLLPGLLVTLLLVVALALLTSPLHEVRRLRPEALAALGQAANWAQLHRGGAYWDHYAQIDPLAAMWSLGITAQFYLVWPVLLVGVLLLCRRSVPAAGALTLLLCAGAAAVAPLRWDGGNSDRLYLGTDGRAVAFLAGATAALLVHQWQRRTHRTRRGGGSSTGLTVVLTVLGTAALAGLVWLSVITTSYHQPWLYRDAGLAAVAVLVAVLTVCLCHDRGPLVRVFSFAPLAATGRISYGLFLLHLPVYWVLQQHTDNAGPAVLLGFGGAVSWLAAWFLHGFTDRIRKAEWRIGRAVPLITAAAVAAGAGAWYLPQVFEARTRPGGGPVVLALGDSLAQDLAASVQQYGSRYTVVDGGISGCGLFGPDSVRVASGQELRTSEECRDRETRWREQLAGAAPTAVVIHVGWDATEQNTGGARLSPCAPEYRELYYPRLQAAVDLVRKQAPAAKVLLMNERIWNGAINLRWGSCYNRHVEDFVQASDGAVQLLDLEKLLCPRGACDATDENGSLLNPRGSGTYLAPAGKRLVGPWLTEQLDLALTAPAAEPAATPEPTAAPSPTAPGPSPSPSPSASATRKPGGPSTRPPTTRPSGSRTATATSRPTG